MTPTYWIVFYVQIMPDDFVSAAPTPDFENDSDFRPSHCQVLPQIQVMPLNSLRISLADYVQLFPSGGIHTAASHPSSISPRQRVTAGSIRRPSVAIVRSPNTCATNRLPEPVIRVKQPALARFSPDVSPLFVHFRADDDVTARLYARGYRLRPEFFKWRKIVLRPTPIMGGCPASNAIHGHINDFLVRTGLRGGVKWNCSCHVLRQ